MKCKTCGYSIPAGKNFCPGCGRVLSKAEQEALASEQGQPDYSKNPENTAYRRPASSGFSAGSDAGKDSSSYSAQQEIEKNIQSIFSTDADAPEYSDPHTYKSATARVIQYDEMYMRRSDENIAPDDEEDEYDEPQAKSFFSRKKHASKASDTQDFEPVQGDYEVEQEYDEDEDDAQDSNRGTRRPVNIKKIMLCVAVVLGLAIIIAGINAIGKQIGLWGDNAPASDSSEEGKTMGEKAPVVKEPDSADTPENESDFKIGTYTVNVADDNGRLYNNHTLDNIIATIPNLTVIEITEVKDESGKCTYGLYTGWIDMNTLIYSPDAKLPEVTTTSAETTTQAETTTEAETTTQLQHPTTPGTYTVDLRGDGQVLKVRADTTTSAEEVGRIANGTTVTVTEVSGDWGYITTEDGIEGWIYMVYLK